MKDKIQRALNKVEAQLGPPPRERSELEIRGTEAVRQALMKRPAAAAPSKRETAYRIGLKRSDIKFDKEIQRAQIEMPSKNEAGRAWLRSANKLGKFAAATAARNLQEAARIRSFAKNYDWACSPQPTANPRLRWKCERCGNTKKTLFCMIHPQKRPSCGAYEGKFVTVADRREALVNARLVKPLDSALVAKKSAGYKAVLEDKAWICPVKTCKHPIPAGTPYKRQKIKMHLNSHGINEDYVNTINEEQQKRMQAGLLAKKEYRAKLWNERAPEYACTLVAGKGVYSCSVCVCV